MSVHADPSDLKHGKNESSTDDIHGKTLPSNTRWGILAGAVVVALGLSFLLAQGFNLAIWLVLVPIVYGAAIYTASRIVEGPRFALDRLVTAIVATFFALALVPLVSVILTVTVKGAERFDIEFFTYSMKGVLGEGGGGYHAIVGTLIITGLAALISVPIGLMTAIYLVEYGNKGPMSRALTFFVDVMTGIPSIVAGLFATSLFTIMLNDPGYRSGIVGAVALSVLMIPTVVKSAEEMLRIVPMDLRECAYALGVPKWLTITKVVIPTAIAGIATGVTLAIARVMGETAPLLVTVGTTTGTNTNPFEDRMETLPLLAYYSYAAPGVPSEPFEARAWTAALVLIILVMILNLVARLIAKVFAPKTK